MTVAGLRPVDWVVVACFGLPVVLWGLRSAWLAIGKKKRKARDDHTDREFD